MLFVVFDFQTQEQFMLKRISVAAVAGVFLLMSLPAAAQDSGVKGFSIGPQVGGQLTTSVYTGDGSDAFSSSPGIGIKAGAQAVYNFNKMFGLQAELFFDNRSYTQELEGQTQSIEASVTENHISLPVMFRYNLPFGGDKIVPKVTVGPYASYWLGGTSEVDGQSSDLESDGVNAFTVGATAGVGVDIQDLGPGDLAIDLRYERGFLNRNADDQTDINQFNQDFLGLSVGYLFGI